MTLSSPLPATLSDPATTGSEPQATVEKVPYAGWENCIRLSNGRIELITTTDVGPRIIRFGFVGGQNLFKEFGGQLGKTGGDAWRIYGGHRFWHAPEDRVRTYMPDNDPVAWRAQEGTLVLTQPVEEANGVQKELAVHLHPTEPRVTVLHRLINRSEEPVELAPWALSVMAAGARAILPQEHFRPHVEQLLPARTLTLWSYTNMADPRFRWGSRFIEVRHDAQHRSSQKLGVLSTLPWMACALNGEVFLKSAGYEAGASYPDMNSNLEVYVGGDMLELETLAPLRPIPPGALAEHREVWSLQELEIGQSEEDVEEALVPLANAQLAWAASAPA